MTESRNWSEVTGITTERFTKPYIKRDRGGQRNYPYGILRVVACNIELVRIFNERLKELGIPRN